MSSPRQLTSKQVLEIQRKYEQRCRCLEDTKDFTIRRLAEAYGVHKNTIMRHVYGLSKRTGGLKVVNLVKPGY